MGDTTLQIPAILRALMAVPATRQQVAHMMSFHLMTQGLLAQPAEGGIAPLSGNPLQYWQGRPVSFLHFERTGGTTLAASLTEKFHPLQIAQAHLQDNPLQPHQDTARDYKLIWGHYDLAALRRIDPDRSIITILREPVARILSVYYFWRSIHPSHLGDMADSRVVLAQTCDLLSFLNSDHQPLRDSIDNVYVRRLTGFYGAGTPHDALMQNSENALSLTRDALKHVAFVGISEHMPETFEGVKKVLGVDLGESMRLNDLVGNAANNPSRYRHITCEELTPEIQAALRQLTRLDRIIYQQSRNKLMQDTENSMEAG